MNRVGLQLPANLFLPQNISSLPVQAAELQTFRVQQQVLATIVEINESEAEAVLEIGGKSYRAPLNDAMQPGQLLQLEVLKGAPNPEFKVLGFSKQDQLSQLFSLLARPYDWSALTEQVQLLAKDNPQFGVLANLFRQFQQTLSPGQQLPAEIAKAMEVLTRQLQGLNRQENRQQALPLMPGSELVYKKPQGDSPATVQNWTRLLTQLKDHIGTAASLPDVQARGQWYGQTRELLGQLQTVVKGGELSVPLMRNLLPLLKQLQQSTPVTPQLARDIQQLNVFVQKQTVTGVLSQDFVADAGSASRLPQGGENGVMAQAREGGLASGSVAAGAPRGQAAEQSSAASGGIVRGEEHVAAAGKPAPVAQLVRQLVTLLGDADEAVPLPAKIVGQLEGALARSIEHGQMATEHLHFFNDLLVQLKSAPDFLTPETLRAKLGVLSLLLGFSVDRSGKARSSDAKGSLLQQSLLALKEQLAGKGDEPLQRLELLQLCRDKLADQQVQFIPLPFADLEEGYLLVRHHSYKDQGHEQNASDDELQLSMALRLSSIGSVRVDMLYGSSGLRLQLAGENRQKMHYLEAFASDLRGALSGIKLVSLGFRDDAQLPTSQLKQKVIAEADQLLNMRV